MNKKNATAPTAPIIIYQPELRPALPCVYGPVDFRDYRDRLVTIDRMLLEGGVEAVFIQAAVAEHAAEWAAASATQLQRFARQSVEALQRRAPAHGPELSRVHGARRREQRAAMVPSYR